MSMTISGVVTNGVIVPSSPLPDGARVEILLKTEEASSRGRGVPAAAVRGIAAGTEAPPDDDTTKRWIQEHRQEKYG